MPSRVLLVDEPNVARAFVLRLKGSGISALCDDAAVGEGEHLACAVLDLRCGGLHVARGLLASSPELPVAFLTAGAPTSEVEAARMMGPVFTKPGGMRDAVEWVRAQVDASARR